MAIWIEPVTLTCKVQEAKFTFLLSYRTSCSTAGACEEYFCVLRVEINILYLRGTGNHLGNSGFWNDFLNQGFSHGSSWV